MIKFELGEASVEVTGMPVIKVIGLGGGGCNALDYMVRNEIMGVNFIAANTDAQSLNKSAASRRVQLGQSGLGAGSNVEKGKQAATDDLDAVRNELKGAHMLFVTAGMGGGTGTGSAPVVAKAAREMGILTVGVVTRPYAFENRDKAAEAGIEELAQHVDSLIVIPNEKLKKLAGKNFSIRRAFDMANEVLHNAVQGVAETITREGFINVDFEDVRTVMSSRGLAMMGVGSAAGEDRAAKATLAAISNPLLEDINIQGARGILVNVMGNDELGLDEYEEVGRMVKEFAHPDATVKIGLTFDDSMSDEVRVTIIATGLSPVGQVTQSKADVKQSEPVAPVQPEPTNGGTRRHWTPLTPSTPATASATKVPGMVASTNIAGLRQGSTGVIGASTNESHAYLNIPSFIRRQAD